MIFMRKYKIFTLVIFLGFSIEVEAQKRPSKKEKLNTATTEFR